MLKIIIEYFYACCLVSKIPQSHMVFKMFTYVLYNEYHNMSCYFYYLNDFYQFKAPATKEIGMVGMDHLEETILI